MNWQVSTPLLYAGLYLEHHWGLPCHRTSTCRKLSRFGLRFLNTQAAHIRPIEVCGGKVQALSYGRVSGGHYRVSGIVTGHCYGGKRSHSHAEPVER